MTAPALYSIILVLLTAFAAGLVGSFALMKRMSLAGDVISHIALPGLGLALLFHFNPLFGGFQSLTLPWFLLGVLAVSGIITFIYAFRHKLILALFSPELAAATGINVARLDLYYLLVFSLTVLLGLRFLGALLVGALIIIPAATGRQLTHTLTRFLFASSAASMLSVAFGFLITRYYSH